MTSFPFSGKPVKTKRFFKPVSLLFLIPVFFLDLTAQECVIIIQGYEKSDEYFASNGADALEEAFTHFPGGAKVTKLRPSGSNKSNKPGTNYSSKADLLQKLKAALCDEKCKNVLLAFVGHGMGGPKGLYDAPASDDDGGMWVGEEGTGANKNSTFIEASEIAALIDECKKEIKLLDSHCYASAMYNGINKALKNKDLLKVALASSKWNEKSKFEWPDNQKEKGFYEFLREFLVDYYKIIGDPNVMEDIRKKAEELKKKAEEDNKKKEAEREQLRKEIAAKEKELTDCNTEKDKLEQELKDLQDEKTKTEQKMADLEALKTSIDEYQKLKDEEKEWSTTKENEKVNEVKKKYADEWKNLPKAQQTKAKQKELENKGKTEIDRIKEQFKEKRDDYKNKLKENENKRKEQSKKLKEEGLKIESSPSGDNQKKIDKELEKQEASKKELEKKIGEKEDALNAKKDKIKTLQDALQALRDKLASILDHSTVPPVMELVLHAAFASAKANTSTSTAEEPQKPVADNEKTTLPDKKMKIIGIDEYVDNGVIKYKRYLNFYKVKDEKTGLCQVVGYWTSSLNGGWPEGPLVSKNCKEDCSNLEVGIKDGDKEIIIKLVKQGNGKYKAEVDGKEQKYREFAYYIPFTPPGSRPELLASLDHIFESVDVPAEFTINGKKLDGQFDPQSGKGQFSYLDHSYDIAFLSHGAVQFTSDGLSWTQQQSRHFSLYDSQGHRIGEAGFAIDGEHASGSLWLEDGEQTLPLSGSFDSYTGQFVLSTHGHTPEFILEKNDPNGVEEMRWQRTDQYGRNVMLPNVSPLPYIEILEDPSTMRRDNLLTNTYSPPEMKWHTVSEGLPDGVMDSYLGTRISKKNQASGAMDYYDFGPGINAWKDANVNVGTRYTYCISSATRNNSICECSGSSPNPPLYSYPQCFSWGPNSPDSIPSPWNTISLTDREMKPFYVFTPVIHSGLPLIPIIGGVVGGSALIYIITKDKKDEDCSFIASAQPSPSSCNLADGSIVITTNIVAEYLWSNGSTSKDLYGITAGTYSVTITRPGTSCTQILQATVTNIDLPIHTTITTTDASCGQSDGSAFASIDPPGSYTYLWSNGSTNQMIESVPAGAYSLTVTGSGTCQDIVEITIGQLPPVFTINTSATPANCGTNNGTATVNVDPPGSYSFLWSDGQTTQQAIGFHAGAYRVTVTITGTNCSQTAQITIEEVPATFTLTIATTAASCGTSDGTATVAVDPPGEYTYLWSDGQSSSQATSLGTGSYSVTITIPGTSCSKSIEVLIPELPPSYTVSTTTTPSGCGVSTGTATSIAEPPGEYLYQWSNGQIGNQAISLFPGQYIVSVTLSGTSCMVTDTITIEQVTPSFTGMISTVPEDCGLGNGSAMIIIDPPGMYTYQWSNQQTGSSLENVIAGMYNVIVTDSNACTASFSTEIVQNPAEYVTITSTVPATCIGGGEIYFTLSTSGPGLLQVEIIYPEGTTSVLLPPGNYQLSSFVNLLPGSYTLNVFDQGIGQGCTESQSTTIEDQTPALSVVSDIYFTIGEQPVIENLLVNDMGINLVVTAVSDVVGGSVTFSGNGQFTYTPNSGFSGEGSFSYVVTDACGNTGTGVVTITVEIANCDFTISTTLIPAHCGLSDGYINVEVNEPGNYTYAWSNGQTGQELVDIPADVYGLTITDVNLGCFLEFEIELTEYPAEYIENIVITQPTCSAQGEILFDVTAPGSQDLLTLLIIHPNGSNQFEIEPGTVLLSDYVEMVPGTYTIEVSIGNAGPECTDGFTVTINQPSLLEIIAQAVFPPSSPSAMDGSAIIVVTLPGSFPYTVLVDGIATATANNNTFTVGGMGVGTHTIQIRDANGCLSNLLIVQIPFPDIILSFGYAISNQTLDAHGLEHLNLPVGSYFSNSLLATLKYHARDVPQQFRFLYTPVRVNRSSFSEFLLETEHRSQLGSITKARYSLCLEGGLGVRYWSPAFMKKTSPYLGLNGTGEIRIGNFACLQFELGLTAWNQIDQPHWMVIANFPFLH